MAIFKVSTSYVHQFLLVDNVSHINGATGKNASLVVKLGKNGAAGVTATGTTAEVDATNLPGVYSITFAPGDVGTLGSLALAATATGCDPTNETHQVWSHILSDLQLDVNNRMLISNNLQQNTALNGFLFPMTNALTGQLMPSLTVTAQRTFGSGGFAPCANAPTEVSPPSGIYAINLNNTDLAGATTGLLLTAPGANTLFVPLVPTP